MTGPRARTDRRVAGEPRDGSLPYCAAGNHRVGYSRAVRSASPRRTFQELTKSITIVVNNNGYYLKYS
jgi:hypothetical protein